MNPHSNTFPSKKTDALLFVLALLPVALYLALRLLGLMSLARLGLMAMAGLAVSALFISRPKFGAFFLFPFFSLPLII